MPPEIHAIVVTRTTPVARDGLRRTLDALRAQTRPVDGMTVVVCGDVATIRDLLDGSGATRVLTAAPTVTFASAVRHAYRHLTAASSAWLLTHDSVPQPEALAHLAAALERAPSVGVAAPKLVEAARPDRIVSLGQTVTRSGATFERAAGDFDQGQHDAVDDVLGADIRGMLVRHDIRESLLPDPALLGVDEGLDIGVRAHLAARRVTLVPRAQVLVPTPAPPSTIGSYFARTAQLHRRLSYAPGLAVLLQWLIILPLAVWNTAGHLLGKVPWRIPGEWGSAIVAMVRLGSIYRSRREIRKLRTRSWASIEPLRANAEQIRERREDPIPAVDRRSLRFFSGGGAWTVLALFAVSVGAFVALLTWPGVGGGGLMPLGDTVASLWRDAAAGLRPEGLHVVGPADPFAAVVAVLGTLWPFSPSLMLLVLWLMAIPAAGLGAWFAATRVSVRPLGRIVFAVAWALSPALLSALTHPRPAGLLVHVLLPWLMFAAVAAHRSWAASGSASLLTVAVAACAPSLLPAFVVLWAISVLLGLVTRPRGLAKLIWTIVPTAAVFAPLAIANVQRGTFWALFSDPGPVYAGGVASLDARTSALWGFSDDTLGGWTSLLSSWNQPQLAWAIPVLLVPIVVLALCAPTSRRWRTGIGVIVVAVLGLATAVVAPGILLAHDAGTLVGVWSGNGLALAWIAVVSGAAITLDVVRVPTVVRAIAGVAVIVTLAVSALPAITALHRGDTELTRGADSTLPAFVAAEAASGIDVGTLVIATTPDGAVSTRVVWGSTERLGGTSTMDATAPVVTEEAQRLAAGAAELISSGATSVPQELAAQAVRFVLVTTDEPAARGGATTTAQRELHDDAVLAMDSRGDYVRVGETTRGILWRFDGETQPRPSLTADQVNTSVTTVMVQLAVVAIALLLSIPTPTTVRQARRTSRVIGATYEERP